MATVLVTLAVSSLYPTAIRLGNDTSDPPPATALTAPAANPAPTSSSASAGVTPADTRGGRARDRYGGVVTPSPATLRCRRWCSPSWCRDGRAGELDRSPSGHDGGPSA